VWPSIRVVAIRDPAPEPLPSLARVDNGVCADSNPPFGQMYILICTKITLLDFDLLFTDGGCTTPFMSFYGLLHYGFSWRPKMSHSVAAKLLRHAELRVGVHPLLPSASIGSRLQGLPLFIVVATLVCITNDMIHVPKIRRPLFNCLVY